MGAGVLSAGVVSAGVLTIGATTFAVIVWGSIAVVALVFAYIAVTYAREIRAGTELRGRER